MRKISKSRNWKEKIRAQGDKKKEIKEKHNKRIESK